MQIGLRAVSQSTPDQLNVGVAAGGPEEYALHMDEVVLQAMNPQRVVIGANVRSVDTVPAGDTCADPLRAYLRAGEVRRTKLRHLRLEPGDRLLLAAEPDRLQAGVASAGCSRASQP